MASKNKQKAPVRRGKSVRASLRASRAARAAKRLKPSGSSKPALDRRPVVEPAGPPPSRPIPELPAHYGEDRITVMARDPWWLFAYWEIRPGTRKGAEKRLRDPHGRIALRVYEIQGDTFSRKNVVKFEDVLVNDQSTGSWYINVWNEGAKYVVEVGILGSEGKFEPIVSSSPLLGSSGSLSEDVDEAWATGDEQYQTMFQLPATTTVTEKTEDAGELEIPPHGSSSMAIQRLLRRKLETELSSGAVGMFSSSSYQPPAGAPGGAASGARTSDFWLQVATEVILYGATEPDAAVTVMGQPVQLRPDGTFTLRFALPEGKFDMPVHATSKDLEHERSITPVVERTTR